MPRLVSERIKKLPGEEIAEISEANRTHMHRRDGGAAADQERRLQLLQEILDELMTLTDWKKP
jgi:predicted AAA+ superfamily ATPase